MFTTATVLYGGTAIEFGFSGQKAVKFHAIWLRYFASRATVSGRPSTQQNIGITDIARHSVILSATVRGEQVRVEFFPENISIDFDIGWLMANRYDQYTIDQPGWVPVDVMMWDGRITNALEFVDYEQIREDRLILSWWLKSVQQTGIGAIKNCPILSGGLLDVAEIFGTTRASPEGDWINEHIDQAGNELNDLATNQVETISPYWDHMPSMQMVYCLENQNEGANLVLVDGFEAVQRLKSKRPDYFELLSHHNARWGALDSDGVYHEARQPMIDLGPDGQLVGLRFSNRTATPFVDIPYTSVPSYFAAYAEFSKLIQGERLAVNLTLAPGDCLLIDNDRVLSATEMRGHRVNYWIQRCFIDRDSVMATLWATEQDLY
jgi:gamma-butyrobetaine dioxygenase